MKNSKIDLTDNIQDTLAKMCEGNPGAFLAMCEIVKHGKEIDPQGAMGGLGAILGLDTLGIYGTDIYILYNDQCKRDVRELLMLLRANQLGFIDSASIKNVASDQMNEVRISAEKMDELNTKVCERLESFRPRKDLPSVNIERKNNANSNMQIRPSYYQRL